MAEQEAKPGKYELLVSRFHKAVNKPGEPYRHEVYRRGDPVELSAEQAGRLLAAGAVRKPESKAEPKSGSSSRPSASSSSSG